MGARKHPRTALEASRNWSWGGHNDGTELKANWMFSHREQDWRWMSETRGEGKEKGKGKGISFGGAQGGNKCPGVGGK